MPSTSQIKALKAARTATSAPPAEIKPVRAATEAKPAVDPKIPAVPAGFFDGKAPAPAAEIRQSTTSAAPAAGVGVAPQAPSSTQNGISSSTPAAPPTTIDLGLGYGSSDESDPEEEASKPPRSASHPRQDLTRLHHAPCLPHQALPYRSLYPCAHCRLTHPATRSAADAAAAAAARLFGNGDPDPPAEKASDMPPPNPHHHTLYKISAGRQGGRWGVEG